jgi:CHAT domain-containing protein
MIILPVLLRVTYSLSLWFSWVFKRHPSGIILACNGCLVLSALANPALELEITPWQSGQFEPAIRHWQAILATDNLTTPQQLTILIQIGNAYQALGLSPQALDALLQAKALFGAAPNHTSITATMKVEMAEIGVKLFTSLSDIYLAQHQDKLAREYINQSKSLVSPLAPLLVQATVLNQEGNVLTAEAYYAKAVATYARCIRLAEQVGDPRLVIRALINKAYTHLKIAQWNQAVTSLQLAQQQLESVPNNYDKAFSLISIGAWAEHIYSQLSAHFLSSLPPDAIQNRIHLQQTAYHTLTAGLKIAKQLAHSRLISYAYGYLGHLNEIEQQYAKALGFTRQAIFYAKQDENSFFSQAEQGSEILYRWQWQLGRLFHQQQQLEAAIKAYQQAVASLQPVRQELAIGYRKTSQPFRERLGAIYLELADLLLQRAEQANDPQPWFKQVLDTIELMKTVELQDYFQDECVTQTNYKQPILKFQPVHTALLYPILLPDRTEWLLSLSNGLIKRFSIPIPATVLKDEVNEFRFELETRETMTFLPYAQRLYRWLIAPLETTLTTQQITTLIMVPDGVLRTIPFAALHDGKQFLIAQYAIATLPSLTLPAPAANPQATVKILINGLSQPVQGYSPLANVVEETHDIQHQYQENAFLLLDQEFTVDHFAQALRNTPYSILHIASHGQFDSNPQKTFLLTYDGKLTMNQLEQFIQLHERRQQPVELLTLSACQTAVGDEQAALGLAGIALKAGVRSALATLWLIDDKATALLIGEFYRQLHQHQQSKAQALQRAQQLLLQDSRYQHPALWAPFLLIGHWQ